MAPGTNLSLLASEINTASNVTLPTKTTTVSPTNPSHGITVLDPSLITTEFDQLRFEAAAYNQLNIFQVKDANLSSQLISSPYNNPSHYLDLTTLDIPNLLLSKALTALKPLRPDYATAPYTEALNLSSVVDIVRRSAADEGYEWKKQTFYVVSFRSQLKEVIDNELLYKLDYESHREACESGGLLKYWFGGPNGERRNLATCFWRSREDARLGGLGPWHQKARMAGQELYDTIVFSTHKFVILDGATDFTFEDWV